MATIRLPAQTAAADGNDFTVTANTVTVLSFFPAPGATLAFRDEATVELKNDNNTYSNAGTLSRETGLVRVLPSLPVDATYRIRKGVTAVAAGVESR